jgi:hypothetical protein
MQLKSNLAFHSCHDPDGVFEAILPNTDQIHFDRTQIIHLAVDLRIVFWDDPQSQALFLLWMIVEMRRIGSQIQPDGAHIIRFQLAFLSGWLAYSGNKEKVLFAWITISINI